jgi:hypothetical protein
MTIAAVPVPARGGANALDDLDRAYGRAYDLAVARGCWVAYGLGTGHWLVASCAAELEQLIAADAITP